MMENGSRPAVKTVQCAPHVFPNHSMNFTKRCAGVATRGLYRPPYEGKLRENLGLPRPASLYATAPQSRRPPNEETDLPAFTRRPVDQTTSENLHCAN